MFQPEAKYEFVRRYCSPAHGWLVFVDIDASELGETGGPRTTPEAAARRQAMQDRGRWAMEQLAALGATVRGSRGPWFDAIACSHETCRRLRVPGDRDIVAIHPAEGRLVVAEVEGLSAGQPETKLYKAIGQLVMAVSETDPGGLDASFVIVVHGDRIGEHLRRASALTRLSVSGLQLDEDPSRDRWLLGQPPGGAICPSASHVSSCNGDRGVGTAHAQLRARDHLGD